MSRVLIEDIGLEQFAAKLATRKVFARVTFNDGRFEDLTMEEYAHFTAPQLERATVKLVECRCEWSRQLPEPHALHCPLRPLPTEER
jgi:hypothetical protein